MNVTSSSTYRLEHAVCCKLEAQQTLRSFQPVHIELFSICVEKRFKLYVTFADSLYVVTPAF